MLRGGDKQATTLGKYFWYFIIFDGLWYCYSLDSYIWLCTIYWDFPQTIAMLHNVPRCVPCFFVLLFSFFNSTFAYIRLSITVLDLLCFSYHITHPSNLFLTLSDVFPLISDSATFQSLVSFDFPSAISLYCFILPIVAKYFTHWLWWTIRHIGGALPFSAFSGVISLHYLVFIPSIC